MFFNKGENCIAAGRIFVEESIHDEFVEKVVAEVKKMKIGDPLDRSTDHGPQNHLAHLKSLLNYVEVCCSVKASTVAKDQDYLSRLVLGHTEWSNIIV